jgi:hypothetical protein
MKIKNTCGAARGFGRIVIKPEQVFDIDDPVAATWFLRHGCVDVNFVPEMSDTEEPADTAESDEDSSYLDDLRGKAREAGIAHWWAKSAVTLTKELAELEEG